MVNPGGTESPSLPISTRLAPLPPKISLVIKFFLGCLSLKLKINFFNYAPSSFEKSIKLSKVLQNIANNSSLFFFTFLFSSLTTTFSKKLSVIFFSTK